MTGVFSKTIRRCHWELRQMVRESLKKFYRKNMNKPRTYTGRLCDVSLDRRRDGYKVMVRDVYLTTGEWMADHLWLTFKVLPYTMGLNIGDVILFAGIVENYARRDGSQDYGIVAVSDSLKRSDLGNICPVLQ